MLIRSSGPVGDDLTLITLGVSCRYVLRTGRTAWLFDAGVSGHVPALIQRLESAGVTPDDLRCIAMTHLDADRIGGIPLLRRWAPQAQLVATGLMSKKLAEPGLIEELRQEDARLSALLPSGAAPEISMEGFRAGLTVDRVVTETETIPLAGERSIRVLTTGGHSAEGIAFLIQPGGYLISDESLGYFRGSQLSAPGADYSIDANAESLTKLLNLEIHGLCLTYQGVLTGELVRRHLSAVVQNAKDLTAEYRRAASEGVPRDEADEQVYEAFFTSSSGDPLHEETLRTSGRKIIGQLRGSI